MQEIQSRDATRSSYSLDKDNTHDAASELMCQVLVQNGFLEGVNILVELRSKKRGHSTKCAHQSLVWCGDCKKCLDCCDCELARIKEALTVW